ncbi:MAG TPA: universal stress protein [Candidatus Thermoplasmatota archaeon]|nr:universal stress protein [Candidatus Thermoplasmatota archaeon]
MSVILVGIDGSPPSRRALDHATRLAREKGHELFLLTVVPEQVKNSSLSSMMPAGLALPPALSQTFEQTAQLRLDEIAAQLAAIGVKARTDVRAGDAARQLLRAADESGASEIVIGQKSYADKTHLGPNARAIRDGAKVPVAMIQ